MKEFFIFCGLIMGFLLIPSFAESKAVKTNAAGFYQSVEEDSSDEKGVGGSHISSGRYALALTSSVLVGLGLGNLIEGDVRGFSAFMTLDLFALGSALSFYFIAKDTGDLPTDEIRYYDIKSRENKIAKDLWIVSMAFFGFYGLLRVIQIVLVAANPYLDATVVTKRRNVVWAKKRYDESKQNFILKRLPLIFASAKGGGIGYARSL